MPKCAKGHNSGKVWRNLFKSESVIYSSSPINCQTAFQAPNWNTFWDILLTRFHLIFSKGHNSRKGDNSNKKKYRSAIFPWRIHKWNFKTLACTVYKICPCIASKRVTDGITHRITHKPKLLRSMCHTEPLALIPNNQLKFIANCLIWNIGHCYLHTRSIFVSHLINIILSLMLIHCVSKQNSQRN